MIQNLRLVGNKKFTHNKILFLIYVYYFYANLIIIYVIYVAWYCFITCTSISIDHINYKILIIYELRSTLSKIEEMAFFIFHFGSTIFLIYG